MHRHYVYRTTHIPTGRWYVGIRSCECDPSADPYLGSGKALASLPKEELSKRVLVIVETREEAARIEAQLVGSAEVSDPMCLNLIGGGSRGRLGMPQPDEVRRKIGDTQRGRPRPIHSAETRAKMRQARLGQRHTPEARERIAAAMRASWRDRECVQARDAGGRFGT